MAFSGPIEDRLAIRELMDIYSDAVISATLRCGHQPGLKTQAGSYR